MMNAAHRLVVLGIVALLAIPAAAQSAAEQQAFTAVSGLIEARCAWPGCHVGSHAGRGLHLDRGSLYRSTVNVPARSRRRVQRVAPGRPEESLLYRVLLPPGTPGALGPSMPASVLAFSAAGERIALGPPATERPGDVDLRKPTSERRWS